MLPKFDHLAMFDAATLLVNHGLSVRQANSLVYMMIQDRYGRDFAGPRKLIRGLETRHEHLWHWMECEKYGGDYAHNMIVWHSLEGGRLVFTHDTPGPAVRDKIEFLQEYYKPWNEQGGYILRVAPQPSPINPVGNVLIVLTAPLIRVQVPKEKKLWYQKVKIDQTRRNRVGLK